MSLNFRLAALILIALVACKSLILACALLVRSARLRDCAGVNGRTGFASMISRYRTD